MCDSVLRAYDAPMIRDETYERFGRLLAEAVEESGGAWEDVVQMLFELVEAQDAALERLTDRLAEAERRLETQAALSSVG